MNNGNNISDEEKEKIREKVASTPDTEKKAVRKELALAYKVTVQTIAAITAWTKIRANQVTSSIFNEKSFSKSEQRKLTHMEIARQHFFYRYSKDIPEEVIIRELCEIFKNFYTIDEIKKIIKKIKNEFSTNDHLHIEIKDPDAKPGERFDYNNETKNASREWWIEQLAQSTQDEVKANIRLLLLPGPECYELEPIIRLGFAPENITTYNLGNDPSASALFIRNNQEYGVYNWRLGDMSDLLPKETERIHGGNLDFTGAYGAKNERILSYLPVPTDGKLHFALNFQKRRETKEITTDYKGVSANINTEIPPHEQSIFTLMETQKINEIKARLGTTPITTIEAREEAIPVLIEESLGVGRKENWLHAQEATELVEASKLCPDFETLDSYSQGKIIRTIIANYEDYLLQNLTRRLAQHFELNESNIQLMTVLIMHACTKSVLNTPYIETIHSHQYTSTKGSPFISYFTTVRMLQKEYKQVAELVRFILQAFTLFFESIFDVNSNEIIDIYMKQEPGAMLKFQSENSFHIEGNKLVAARKIVQSKKYSIPLSTFFQQLNLYSQLLSQLHQLSNGLKDDLNLDSSHKSSQAVSNIRHKFNSNRINQTVRVGRNEGCPCGSGKKFKKCCGKKH